MKIKSVDIVFENCESLKFMYPDIFYFDIGEVTQKYKSYLGSICLCNTIDDFELCIRKDAVPQCNIFNNMKNPLDRIMNDITQLHVEFLCGQKILYYINWPSECVNYHDNQVVIKMSNDDIFVKSSLKKFDKSKITNKNKLLSLSKALTAVYYT